MGIPDPKIQEFARAPEGKVRVVAWRQRTSTWPDPELASIHAERAALLHWWADAYGLEVDDWGSTDAERPSEFVEMLLEVGQAALTAGLGALASGFVKQYFEARKAKAAQKAPPDQAQEVSPPPDCRPLFALTIINESGGTVLVLDGNAPDQVNQSIARATNPTWRGQETVV
jgi:hypothetical protein